MQSPVDFICRSACGSVVPIPTRLSAESTNKVSVSTARSPDAFIAPVTVTPVAVVDKRVVAP